MQSRIHSKNLDLAPDQLDYIQERVERLTKYAGRIGDESTLVDVEVHRNEHKTSGKSITMEMTINAPHATIRSEVSDLTVEAAADQAFEKLKKQVGRYKSKSDRRHKSGKMMPEPTLAPVLEAATEKPADEIPVGKVVKRKVFPVDAACTDAEAIEQMELLAHNFFVYKSSDTGRVSVSYKREDGNYGILEIEG